MPNKLLITVVVLLGLTGCNAGTPAASQQVADASGITGAIQHGRVTLSIIGERSIKQVAEARTNADGTFSMDLPGNIHQPMLLEVKPSADGRSRMVCDSEGGCGDFARGETMPVPDSFRMLALVAPGELNGRQLSVNPYTHIATHEAVQFEGLLDSRLITRVRQRIARGYGINGSFWQQDSGNVSGSLLNGVAVASVASPRHRLVLDNNGTVDVRAEVTTGEGACGPVQCEAMRVAQNLATGQAAQQPATLLF